MSHTRYLEFDSTYRDRSLYPLESDFIVEMAQSGQKSKLNATDPISEASPILIWNNNFVSNLPYQNFISDLIVSSSPSSQGNSVITLLDPNNSLRQVRNFYVGCLVSRTTGAYPPPLFPGTQKTARRIIDYKPINLGTAILTLESPLPDALVGLSGFYIENPTPIPTNTANSLIKLFIPVSNKNLVNSEKTEQFGSGGENFYINHYVQNTDTGESKKITEFDTLTRLATLESATTVDWRVLSTANFVIRKSLPIERGQLQAFISLNQVRLSALSIGDQTGNFIRLLPLQNGPISLSSPYTAPYTEERRIVQFDLTTKIATVYPAFTALGVANDYYEIEDFSRDNNTPFVYSGSLVSSAEPVCYEVELLNLILPNAILATCKGGRPIFYPYVYVQLQQISSGSGVNKNIMYSNNPNSFNMLFRAILDDTPIPVISPFIKIGSDGMRHVIKFKPNDSFRFSVYHLNGDHFKSIYTETMSPTIPNPLSQISACFSFKRI